MVLLAALRGAARPLTGQRDLVVGTPVASRTRAEIEGLIGLFVNTLALRADLGGEPGASRGACSAGCAQICLGAYAHQDLPFEQLVEELAPERDPAARRSSR